MSRLEKKSRGGFYTEKAVACYMLEMCGFRPDNDLRNISILEPSAGEGVFALEILERLYASSEQFVFSFEQALRNLMFVELDYATAQKMVASISSFFDQIGLHYDAKSLVFNGDFLTHPFKQQFNIVIGNPPYLRWDAIQTTHKKTYKKLFKTFRHRSDLYIPFYEKGLSLLKHEGRLCYLCSNRWFKNQYGKPLRQLISERYTIDTILDLETASPFEDKNLTTYPAITLIQNKRDQGKKIKYKKISHFSATDITSLKTIPWNKTAEVWQFSTSPTLSQKHYSKIEDQGFSIGIGIATGCDEVFIGEYLDETVEPDRLLPILKSSDLKNNQFKPPKNSLLNPFEPDGSLIDLEKFPKTKKYFDQHKLRLSNRHIARKKPSYWYRTIDKVKSGLISTNKILLPDITGNSRIFIDKGNYYPHHNLYYITEQSNNIRRLYLLACILMSDMALNQLLNISNKMNGGYPRWQSQNLRRLVLPIIDNLAEPFQDKLIEAYFNEDLKTINALLKDEQVKKHYHPSGQLSIFESPTTRYH